MKSSPTRLPGLLPMLGLLAAALTVPTLALAQPGEETTTTTTVTSPPGPMMGPDGQPMMYPGGQGQGGPGGPGMGHRGHKSPHGGMGGMMKLRLVPLNPGLGAYFHTNQGLLVAEAAPDNALGLRAGDVLQAVNGTPVTDPRSVWMAVRAAGGPGATVTLAGMRQGQPMTLRATLPSREVMMQEAQRLRAERQAQGMGQGQGQYGQGQYGQGQYGQGQYGQGQYGQGQYGQGQGMPMQPPQPMPSGPQAPAY